MRLSKRNMAIIWMCLSILLIAGGFIAWDAYPFNAEEQVRKAQSLMVDESTSDAVAVENYLALMNRAAKSGNFDAQLALGSAYSFGLPRDGLKKNLLVGRKWIEAAMKSNKDSNAAKLALAALCLITETSEDRKKALDIYEQVYSGMAKSGVQKLEDIIPVVDPILKIVESRSFQDSQKNVKYLTILARLGDAKSQVMLAVELSSESADKGQDLSDEARMWATKAYDMRDPLAAVVLAIDANAQFMKNKDEKLRDRAIELLRIATTEKSNSPRNVYYKRATEQAFGYLVLLLLKKNSIDPDPLREDEIEKILDRFAAMSTQDSDENLKVNQVYAILIYSGYEGKAEGYKMPVNFSKAFQLANKVASTNPMAGYYLGQMYADGRGVAVDKVKAHQTFLMCSPSEASCQKMVGLDYFLGSGVPRDVMLGNEWLERAAKNGDTRSMIYIAERLVSDSPAPFADHQDVEQARKLLARAVKAGDLDAQGKLDKLTAVKP